MTVGYSITCLSATLSLPLSPAQWSLGWELERWKEKKMPFDPSALCYSSVKEHYHDNPSKKIIQRVSKPNMQTFNGHTSNAQAKYGQAEWEFSRIDIASLPSAFFHSFSLLVICFLCVSYSQHYKAVTIQPTECFTLGCSDQITLKCTQCCIVGSYSISCLIYSLRGESDITLLLCREHKEITERPLKLPGRQIDFSPVRNTPYI